MAYQNNAVVLAAVRRETTPYSIATTTGATQMRITASPGMVHSRAPIQSQEKRSDALRAMMRLGYKSEAGSFNSELTVGGHNDLFMEALMRVTNTAARNIAFASVTTVAISTNYLSCGAGSSFPTAGVRVGDVFYLTGTTVSGDNNVNTQVLALTTQTITVATGAFTTLAATATGTLTLLKKMVNATTPVDFLHSIDQLDSTLLKSETFIGCMVVGCRMSFRPGQPIQLTWSLIGTDRQLNQPGPYFTSPSLTTSVPLLFEDAQIRYNGALAAVFTGMDINFTLNARGEPVGGSLVTPSLFANDLAVDGSITSLRSDFSNLTLYDAETEFEMSMLLQEPSGTPKAAWGLFFPRVKLGGVQADFGGGDGGKIETLTLGIGPKTAATGYDAGYLTVSSSGA